MKAAICAINSKYAHSSLAVWYLAAGIDKHSLSDINYKVIEGSINQNYNSLVNAIYEYSPDLIGFSCYIWNISYISEVIPLIKELLPNSLIVLGGPEVSYNQSDVFKKIPRTDYIISGEGELPFSRLADALNLKSGVHDVSGLSYIDKGRLISNPLSDADYEPPSPYSDEYYRSLRGRIAYIETSRGCPFSCSFCLSGLNHKTKFFNIDRVKSDIIQLANSSAQTIKFVDRTFNCNPDRAYEIFEFIIDSCGKLFDSSKRFHFEVAADLFDDRTIRLLLKAPVGLFQLEAGLQSFNEASLKAINRKTDLSLIEKNLSALISQGNIHIHIDLITGLPYEKLESFKRSFDRAYALRPHMLQLGFLKLLHGSKLREEAQNYSYEFSSDPPYEFISNKWISACDKDVLICAEDALERMSNSGRFALTLDYILTETQISPFDFFCDLGLYLNNYQTFKISLDKFTNLIWQYFSTKSNLSKRKLRNAMVCDRLSSNKSGRLPNCLKIMDSRLTREKSKHKIDGKKIGAAILYGHEDMLVVCDYNKYNSITKRYKLDFYKITS